MTHRVLYNIYKHCFFLLFIISSRLDNYRMKAYKIQRLNTSLRAFTIHSPDVPSDNELEAEDPTDDGEWLDILGKKCYI